MKFHKIYYEEVDSTNSVAWRLVDRYLAESTFGTELDGTVAIAKQQTKGRGQRGHSWVSPLGGLYLSVILQLHLPVALASQITLWAAWGIASALRETGANVRIKWLNDLVIDGCKLGGILTETRVSDGNIAYAVVGIGINWLNPVPDQAIALAEALSNLTDLEELTEVVLSGVQQGRDRYVAEGITPILSDYLGLLDRQTVTIWHEGREQKASIFDITSTGDLVVRWEDNLQTSTYPPGTLTLGYTA